MLQRQRKSKQLFHSNGKFNQPTSYRPRYYCPSRKRVGSDGGRRNGPDKSSAVWHNMYRNIPCVASSLDLCLRIEPSSIFAFILRAALLECGHFFSICIEPGMSLCPSSIDRGTRPILSRNAGFLKCTETLCLRADPRMGWDDFWLVRNTERFNL